MEYRITLINHFCITFIDSFITPRGISIWNVNLTRLEINFSVTMSYTPIRRCCYTIYTIDLKWRNKNSFEGTNDDGGGGGFSIRVWDHGRVI